MEPAVEVQVHEGLEGAALAHELGPHALEAGHDYGKSPLHRRRGASLREELSERCDGRWVERV